MDTRSENYRRAAGALVPLTKTHFSCPVQSYACIWIHAVDALRYTNGVSILGVPPCATILKPVCHHDFWDAFHQTHLGLVGYSSPRSGRYRTFELGLSRLAYASPPLP